MKKLTTLFFATIIAYTAASNPESPASIIYEERPEYSEETEENSQEKTVPYQELINLIKQKTTSKTIINQIFQELYADPKHPINDRLNMI